MTATDTATGLITMQDYACAAYAAARARGVPDLSGEGMPYAVARLHRRVVWIAGQSFAGGRTTMTAHLVLEALDLLEACAPGECGGVLRALDPQFPDQPTPWDVARSRRMHPASSLVLHELAGAVFDAWELGQPGKLHLALASLVARALHTMAVTDGDPTPVLHAALAAGEAR